MLRAIITILTILCLSHTLFLSQTAISEESGAVCKDKPDGMTKEYSEDGKLMTEWMCKNGQLHGISKLYYPNGQLEKASSYRNDVRQGITYGYYDSGTIKSICNYKDGKLNGVHKIYYENGQIKEFTIYRDGVNQGEGGEHDHVNH